MPIAPRHRSAARRRGPALAHRLMAGAVVAGLFLAAPGPRAWAHAGAGQIIMTGRVEAVSIAVNAETDAPMTAVDVTIPGGFALSSAPAAVPGSGGARWAVTRQGQVLHYRGAGIDDGGMLYIELLGTARGAGTLPFATTTHAADGTTVRWDGPASSDHPAALVQVLGGPGAGASHAPSSKAPATPLPSGYAAGLVALAGAGLAIGWRRRVRTR